MKRKPTLKEASPSPSKGGDVPNPTYILSSFQTVCNKDIPSFGGAWGGFFFGVGLYPACGPVWSSLPSPFGEGAGVRLFSSSSFFLNDS